MPVRTCFFIVENDGTFWRMPKKTFYRILQPRDGEAYPEFAGQRVRYAQIVVVHDGTRPASVARASFHSLKFDGAGCLDDDDVLKQQQLAVQLLHDPDDMNQPHSRAARIESVNAEFDLRFGWAPADELRERLFAAALANKRVARAVN